MSAYQPLVNTIVAEVSTALGSVDPEALAALEALMRRAPRIFVAGTGRSGLCLRAFAMRLMHLGLPAYVVGDVTTPSLAAADLLLIGSGSGRTASVVQCATRAKALQATVALITTARQSPIADLADQIVLIEAPTPKSSQAAQAFSIQPMGTLFEQTLGLLLDVVVLQLMQALAISAEQMFARHANLE
jgi:6-phospho-3-hexuloisomerase